MNSTYEKYIHDFTKALEVEAKIKKRIVSDIRCDIESKLSKGEKIDEILGNLDNPKELAKDFNQSYPEYKKTKILYRVRSYSIIGLIVAFTFSVIGFVGRSGIFNRSNVSHTGGVDLPTQIITSSAPVSMLSVFDNLIKISFIIALFALIAMGYFVAKKRMGSKEKI